jgi:hypothetical protein
VTVPLNRLEGSGGAALLVDRFSRRETAANREALRRLIQGTATCGSCGSTVLHDHSRSCFSQALTAAGVPLHERESILSKITFPEG